MPRTRRREIEKEEANGGKACNKKEAIGVEDCIEVSQAVGLSGSQAVGLSGSK